jgi:hypothetical protein
MVRTMMKGFTALTSLAVVLGGGGVAQAQSFDNEAPYSAIVCPQTETYLNCLTTCCQDQVGNYCQNTAGFQSCQLSCGGEWVQFDWTLGRYTNGAAGEVALMTDTGSMSETILQQLGLTYTHAALLTSTAGQTFTDSTYNGVPPRETANVLGSTGVHACTDVLYVRDLTGLSPGVRVASVNDDDVMSGAVLLQSMATATCAPKADTYHMSSWFFPKPSGYYPDPKEATPLTGGSCEKVLQDECGAPVIQDDKSPTEAGVGFTPQQIFNGADAFWNQAYNACMGQVNLSWLQSLACDGLSNTTACQEAAFQLVNEVLLKYATAMDECGQCNEQAGCNPASQSQASGKCNSYCVGFQEDNGCAYNSRGQPLGAGSLNNQANYLGQSDGKGGGTPASSGTYASTWYNDDYAAFPNVPDALYNAAKRLNSANTSGKQGYRVNATVAPGYYSAPTMPSGWGTSCGSN